MHLEASVFDVKLLSAPLNLNQGPYIFDGSKPGQVSGTVGDDLFMQAYVTSPNVWQG